jgi:three-Cys-motif partner protein
VPGSTKIEWTDLTWNVWTGCTQVSPGCAHCYAKELAEGRFARHFPNGFGLTYHWERLRWPLGVRTPSRIFVNSMTDMFLESVPDEAILRVFCLMAEADWHTFQILTKRHERLAALAPDLPWPANVWMGVSIENNRFVHRADYLRRVPAAVRFLSCEPLLGPLPDLDLTGIDWVIVGGESGPRRRPMQAEWVRDLRDRTKASGAAFFFKQGNGLRPGLGRWLDGRTWDEMPPLEIGAASRPDGVVRMSRNRGTVWEIEPHTLAKHAILRRYLDAWLPIMSRWHGRVVYVDGFAGPGRYAGGEDGSPIVALKAALNHPRPITAELVYLFIEEQVDRKANLELEISRLTLPANIKVRVLLGTWDDEMTGLLDHLSRSGAQLAPVFAFVDPFGWSHTPFATIRRLLSNPRCEVLINLMYEEVNRFLSHPSHAGTWDRLFGTPSWRSIVPAKGAVQRRGFIHDLYFQQLKQDAKARFVRSFEMRNQHNVTDYFLFFATNNSTGLCKMKESMWRVDRYGSFLFSDATVRGQPVLFEPEPDYSLLQRQVVAHFAGGTADVGEVERFVVEDTAFLPSHYKRRVLVKMEASVPPGLDVVSAPPGRKRGTFPPGTVIRFAPVP